MDLSALTVTDAFRSWRAVTVAPSATVWSELANWGNANLLDQLLDLFEDELEARWNQSPEEITVMCAAVVEDLSGMETPSCVAAASQLHFLRFFVVVKAAEYCQRYGRASLEYDWLLCAVSDEQYEPKEAGVPKEVDYFPERLLQFANSEHPSIKPATPSIVLKFLQMLFYYAWKSAGHRELAEKTFALARPFIVAYLESSENALQVQAISAASALASWCQRGKKEEAGLIACFLASTYERADIPDEGKKVIGITLATDLGQYTDRTHQEWAKRVLAEHQALLVEHESVHMLLAACNGPEEMVERYGEILGVVEDFVAKAEVHFAGNQTAHCFRQIQLFELIAPLIFGLLELGRCKEAVEVCAAWFSVPKGRRRNSPVVAAVPGHRAGAFYAVDDDPFVFKRDSIASMKNFIGAVNTAFDTNIVVRDDPSHQARPREGRWEPASRFRDEFAEATADFYALEQAKEFLHERAHGSHALFQVHAIPAPIIPLARARIGMTWPMVTSFEEPADDRPLKKVLIVSDGTILGGHEPRAIVQVMQAAKIECVTSIDEKLSPKQFLALYDDESFDAILVAAHGVFDSREPHRAYIALSEDASKRIHLTELLLHPVRGNGRRLLFLNICLGGAVLVTEAPPRLGLGAMLASANQAVVCHVAEVSSFVAPLFGVAAAITLAQGKNFFDSFTVALDTIRLDRQDAKKFVHDAAPQCADFIERLNSGPYGVDDKDTRTWGTAVFYE